MAELPLNRSSLHQLLLEQAKEHGFPLAGALDLSEASLDSHIAAYDRWLANGYAGAMSYLERGRDRRADPRLVFPEAKSILCVAWPYSSKPAGAENHATGPRYSRYLRSGDYHKDIAARLEAMMVRINEAWTAKGTAKLNWKVCVDTSAVLERTWAALAGLGWIGKNKLLIHPQYGSYLFLAEVFLSEETGAKPNPMPSYCGNCTRCLDACPAKAFTPEGLLDSNRCISYLTLEKRGEFDAPLEIQSKTGTWIAGCDICQEVCPFNTKVSKRPLELDDAAISIKDWETLLMETEEQYRERVKGSALNRVKPAQFRRNLANALNNTLNGCSAAEREQLQRLRPLIEIRLKSENEESLKIEWRRLLDLLEI